MLLKQIRIKNFKSHKDTVLDLHEGINTIYGNPQAGKSNIMRALELLKDNRPVGAKFMPKWAGKECETHISILDNEDVEIGIKVHCKKSKAGVKKRESTYYYIHDHATDDIWDSTGVGKEVPAEITKALALTDINIQFQKDPPFLATKSGSKISKTVNKITGLDIGDNLISHLTKKLNEQKAIVKNVDADLAMEKENLKNFPNVKDLAGYIKRTEKLMALIDKHTERIDSLENYINRFRDLGQVAEIRDMDEEISRVKVLNNDIETGRKEINELEKFLLALKNLKTIKELPDLSKPFNQVSVLNSRIQKGRLSIKELNQAINTKKEYLEALSDREGATNNLIEFLAKLKKCPTCFQSIDKDKLKKIIRGM